MDKYRNALKIRLWFSALYCAAVVTVILLGMFRPGDAHGNDYISGFSLGMCCGIAFVMITFMIKIIGALRNPEKLKKLYIKETDERIRLIQSKAGSAGISVAVAGILLAAIVAGYWNATVFFTLIAAALFISLVVLAMKAFYWSKYTE